MAGLTSMASRRMGCVQSREVLKYSTIVKPALPTAVPRANISPKSQPTLVLLLEKMNEIRAVFGEWPELAKLVGSLLPGPRKPRRGHRRICSKSYGKRVLRNSERSFRRAETLCLTGSDGQT